MAKRITQLPAATSLAAADVLAIVKDPAGSATTQKLTGALLRTYVLTVSGGTATIAENVTVSGQFRASSYAAIGGAVNDGIGLYIRNTLTSTQTSQYGCFVNFTASSSATAEVAGQYITTTLGANVTTQSGVLVSAPGVSAFAPTSYHGIQVAATTLTGTTTTAYGVRIGNISGATTNYALFTGTGQVRFGDVVAVGAATPSTSTYLVTPAGTTGVSPLRIPHGSAPFAPVNGDIWTTTAGLFVRINGVTVGPLT